MWNVIGLCCLAYDEKEWNLGINSRTVDLGIFVLYSNEYSFLDYIYIRKFSIPAKRLEKCVESVVYSAET